MVAKHLRVARAFKQANADLVIDDLTGDTVTIGHPKPANDLQTNPAAQEQEDELSEESSPNESNEQGTSSSEINTGKDARPLLDHLH